MEKGKPLFEILGDNLELELEDKLTYITVKWEQPGFHWWSQATGNRKYLGYRHRHLFKYSFTTQVFHDDREIEFHDLQDHLSSFTARRTEHEGRSCEMLAEEIILEFAQNVNKTVDKKRFVKCLVSEDGEVEATVECYI